MGKNCRRNAEAWQAIPCRKVKGCRKGGKRNEIKEKGGKVERRTNKSEKILKEREAETSEASG